MLHFTQRLMFLTIILLGTWHAQAFGQTFLQQSPINIDTSEVLRVRPGKAFAPLEFLYTGNAKLSVQNTGSPDEEATIRATITNDVGQLWLGADRYDLLQFHWHGPGEHTIHGYRSPMEMHLVHARPNYQGSYDILVVAVMLELGKPNAELEKIFKQLPPDEEALPVKIDKFNLTRLLPGSRKSYRYTGSLTTYPYTEGVQWIVMAEPIGISENQLIAFQELFPGGDNRETQALNGRIITTDLNIGKPR